MFSKKLGTSKAIQLLLATLLLLFAIVLIVFNTSTITNPITIDYEKKTFSGTLPVIILLGSGIFFWFGLKEKKMNLAMRKRPFMMPPTNLRDV